MAELMLYLTLTIAMGYRYVRITRLLSIPLLLRIRDWLCVLPANTLVVDKSKKVNKAAS